MLTEFEVKNAKPRNVSYMIRDEHGLYLRVDPSGCKYWILRYWENKKEHKKSLGPYPELSLKEARKKSAVLRSARAKGENISARSEKTPQIFSEVPAEWLKIRMRGKAENYLLTIHFRLNKYILPEIGGMSLNEIEAPDILRLCRKIEASGHAETARRVRTVIGQIFRFAIASGWTKYDPTAALLGALSPRRNKNYATLTDPREISILIKAMKAYPYTLIRCAMLFSIYTAARPGEIRAAEWSEIKDDVWDIPAEKMKMKRRHIVPLSKQAKKILEELRPLTGKGRWLFPTPRNNGKCMSENGVRVALRTIGFTKEQITPHGFRAMFSTIANEHGWNRDVIERQLAHVEENSVRGAYNHAEYMPERIKIMQWWADWLDNLS
ncbi:MAG: tyrosine-type recombinase/integrase [Synergistaceae bacterium]|nr:tyrosine-type recombinase/integrase [Synergistaceae bacterium]